MLVASCELLGKITIKRCGSLLDQRWLFSTFVPRRLEFDPRARTGKDARQRKFHALRFPVELSIDAYNSRFNTALTALCGVLHQ